MSISIFDNYENNTTLPDNRYKFLPEKCPYKDSIIRGAKAEHCFKIPHNLEDIQSAEVNYFQGIEQKLVIPNDRITIKDEYDSEDSTEENIENTCWATYTLTEQESLVFNAYNTQVNVQLKIILNDGSIEYSSIYKIRILPTLFTMEEDTNV